MSQTVLFFGVYLMSVNIFAWQAMVISMWQTGIQDEDITLTTPNAFCPLLCLQNPCPPSVPHPWSTRLIIVRIPSRQWWCFNLVWM